jgi:hypothetical protein
MKLTGGCQPLAPAVLYPQEHSWYSVPFRDLVNLGTLRIAPSGMLCSVAFVRTDVSEELSASFIKVTRIGELGTMLAVIGSQFGISSQRASIASYS